MFGIITEISTVETLSTIMKKTELSLHKKMKVTILGNKLRYTTECI
jgi:hypothetical protein